MSNNNRITLAGSFTNAELKSIKNHTFIKIRITTDDSQIPISVSAYVNETNMKQAQEIVQTFSENNDLSVVVYNGFESGSNKGDGYNFYDVSTEVSQIKIIHGKIKSVNAAVINGSVKEIQETEDGHWIVVGCPYFSKNPKKKEKGEWKERFAKVFVEKNRWNALPVEGSEVFIFGKVMEKHKSYFAHHILATSAAALG